MSHFKGFSPLTDWVDERPMNGSSHNDPGYPRHKIDRVVIHHNATTNYKVALSTWLKTGRAMTSAHYEITPTQIIGCVDETRSAWHAGNKAMNQRSIGLEHVNETGTPNWKVAEATLKNSARLCADICKRYDIPIDSTHIIPHKAVVATSCPGGINMTHYINLVKAAAGQKVTPVPAPKPTAKPKPAAKPATTSSGWHAQRGTFTVGVSEGIKLRSGSASVKAPLLAVLSHGSQVKYDAYGYFGGYVWIRQPRSGGYGYLPTGTASGTTRTSRWGTFK